MINWIESKENSYFITDRSTNLSRIIVDVVIHGHLTYRWFSSAIIELLYFAIVASVLIHVITIVALFRRRYDSITTIFLIAARINPVVAIVAS